MYVENTVNVHGLTSSNFLRTRDLPRYAPTLRKLPEKATDNTIKLTLSPWQGSYWHRAIF